MNVPDQFATLRPLVLTPMAASRAHAIWATAETALHAKVRAVLVSCHDTRGEMNRSMLDELYFGSIDVNY